MRQSAPDCPVIVFSGQTEGLEGVEADARIFKPVAMPVFLQEVRAVLSKENACLTAE